jgi:hypothetical protein
VTRPHAEEDHESGKAGRKEGSNRLHGEAGG